jgi:tetratricopeptide (TPR) repeat protein
MKRLILAVVSVAVIGGSTLYLNRQKVVPISPAESMAEAAPSRTPEDTQSVKTVAVQQTEPRVSAIAANPNQTPLVSPVLNETKLDNSANSTAPTAFRQAIDILVSPQTSFQQRQAAWKQLRDAGELDQALATLKQGATNNPSSAEYPMALGEAYVYKLQTIRDFHEVAILALQADQSFNTALGLDPANWEARFFKAASLSHWQPEMNKGPEVIQQFSNLIDQQEAMPPQPQFA